MGDPQIVGVEETLVRALPVLERVLPVAMSQHAYAAPLGKRSISANALELMARLVPLLCMVVLLQWITNSVLQTSNVKSIDCLRPIVYPFLSGVIDQQLSGVMVGLWKARIHQRRMKVI